MTDSTRITIGRSMAAIGIVAAAAGFVWLFALGHRAELWELWIVHNALVAIPAGVIVWLVVPGQPRNSAVWILAWSGLFTGLEVLGFGALAQGVESLGLSASVMALVPAELPTWLAVIAMQVNWLWVGVLLMLGVLYVFPDGSTLSPRFRLLFRLFLLVVALTAFGMFWEARPSSTFTLSESQDTNGGFRSLTSSFVTVGYPATFILVLGGAASLVVRFRRSQGVERQQFRWIALGASFTGAMVLGALLADEVAGRLDIALYLGALGFLALLGSVGIAIGKYRLYDIDAAISRTVVLAVLAGFITATYALIVVGVGALIGGDSDGLLLPISATAMVAIAFEPVRVRAQHWANRLVYGKRATPYEVLSELTERLSAAEEGEGILDRMAELLREGTGADRTTIWLGAPGRMASGVSSPSDAAARSEPALDDISAFPVLHDGKIVGALEVVKPKGTALSSAERSLITDLAGSAGAVLGYQRLNDSLAERASALEASRQRLVEAQGMERRRLERELHEGAEQYIVALKVKLGVATQLARRQGATDLGRILDGLTDEAQAALDDVRSLAKGIYPPILESDGLGAAVSALIASTPVDIQFKRDGVGRYSLDVEAAVYFDISEAMTNAVKHAETPISVELQEQAGSLQFSVRDSGPGFEIDTHDPGSGLENMADRMSAVGGKLGVETSVGGHTVVWGSVPLHTEVSTEGSNSDLDTNATAPASSARA